MPNHTAAHDAPQPAATAAALDPTRAFEQERAERIGTLARDDHLRRLSLQWMMDASRHKYTYNFSWLGRPVIQYPQDLFAAQEIIWRTQPDLIIETGVAHGGSLLFWASLLELLGGERLVVGIDIEIRPHNRRAIDAHPLVRRVRLIEGSSVDPVIARQAAAVAKRHRRVMVILDSHHAHAHVLRELQLYGPLVTSGCYLIVFDTVIEDLPHGFLDDSRWDEGDNPKTAVHEYLRMTTRFRIDDAIPAKLMITTAPDGYLECIET
jgi:cephalosporin hydroxylase